MEGPGVEECGLWWSKVASEVEPEEGSVEFVSDFAENRDWDRGEGLRAGVCSGDGPWRSSKFLEREPYWIPVATVTKYHKPSA